MSSSTVNSTTPMPSLNSDSPATTSPTSSGARAARRMPITAIGSVGEIRAPNTRHHGSDSGNPTSGASHHIAIATSTVDSSVPPSASNATGPACLRSRPTSTCNAPANSSIESMPSISSLEKSMERSSAMACSRRCGTPSTSSPTIATDSANAIAMTPMVAGRWTKRAFA